MARGLGNGSCKPLLQPGQGAELAQLRLLTAIQPQKQGAGHPVLGLGLLAITKVLWALNCWPLSVATFCCFSGWALGTKSPLVVVLMALMLGTPG